MDGSFVGRPSYHRMVKFLVSVCFPVLFLNHYVVSLKLRPIHLQMLLIMYYLNPKSVSTYSIFLRVFFSSMTYRHHDANMCKVN